MDSKVSYKDRKPHQVILTLNHSPVYSYRCKTEVSTVNNNTANQVDKVLSLFNNDLHSFISGKCKHQNTFDLLLIKRNKHFSFLNSGDAKAQKNGPHRSVYWVKKKPRQEDGSIKGEMWQEASRYIGDWRDNCKEGFGIQFYNNGDKYEGMWAMDKKHGQGTYWRNENGKLRREYTGDWFEDKKHGRGTFFFKNSDRYDGYWVNGMP